MDIQTLKKKFNSGQELSYEEQDWLLEQANKQLSTTITYAQFVQKYKELTRLIKEFYYGKYVRVFKDNHDRFCIEGITFDNKIISLSLAHFYNGGNDWDILDIPSDALGDLDAYLEQLIKAKADIEAAEKRAAHACSACT